MPVLYHGKRLLLLAFIVVYLLTNFIDSHALIHVGGGILALMIVLMFPKLPKTNMIVCGLMLGIGLIIFGVSGNLGPKMLDALMQNGGLVALMMISPILSMPFSYDDYPEELKHVAQRHMNRVVPFLLLTAVAVHLLGVAVNIAAVPIIYALLAPNADLYKAKPLFLMAIIHGYVTTSFYSPLWLGVSLVNSNLEISLAQIIPFGLIMTAVVIAISIKMLSGRVKREPERFPNVPRDENVKVNWKRLWTLVALTVALMAIIVLVDSLSNLPLLTVIPLMTIPFAFGVALLLKKLPRFTSGIKGYYTDHLADFKNEILIFVSAGFLGNAVVTSGYGTVIAQIFPTEYAWIPGLMPIIILGITMLLCYVGINAMVTVTILILAVPPAAVGMSTFVYGLTIISAFGLSAMTSPFSITNLLVGNMMKVSPWEISLKTNGKFSLLLVILFSVILGFLSKVM